ncbi:hypothetical protein M23134_02652 [Microscilla marina ATCC 23134]|uniref:Uncharacterized protein n=2 Tax=Microscilla marina TaxID=1027 RepID=A1ZNU4_MICM2|nr:hypothetical protein M23134_02652 [Microscilla marina ATCC 23134]
MYIQKENIQPSIDQTEIIRAHKNDGLKMIEKNNTKSYWITCITLLLAGNFYSIQAQNKARKYQSAYNRSYQEFDTVQDYQGQTHFVLHLLVSLDKTTTQVILSQSIDGKKWENIKTQRIQKGYKASLQNVPLTFELSTTKELLKNINKQVYFRVTPSNQKGEKSQACGVAQISKQKLLKLQEDANAANHLAKRHK